MKNITKSKWLIFSGGRGNTSLIEAMKTYIDQNKYKFSVIINGLDDGSSTGEIRRLLNYNCHGISDFLKVIVSLSSEELLVKSLNCRFPKVKSFKDKLKLYHELFLFIEENTIPDYLSPLRALPVEQLSYTKEQLYLFLKYCYLKRHELVNIDDFKVGNIVFASMLLDNAVNFNKALMEFSKFCGIPSNDKIKILPNTDDVRYLAGVLKNGTLLPNEAAVVRTRTTDFIQDIFQIPMPLDMNQIRKLSSVEIEEKLQMLSSISAVPKIADMVADEIETSTLIIYGIGTPYSSILPTIETKGMARCIANNNSPKVMISNLKKECSNSMSVAHLIDDLVEYFKRSLSENSENIDPQKLLTHVIVPNQTNEDDQNTINVYEENIKKTYPWLKIVKGDITIKEDRYRHDGEKLFKILEAIAMDL